MKKNSKKKNTSNSEHWSHKHDYGHPDGFKDIREWNATIQKMIDAFELMKYTDCLSEEETKTFSEGITLFCKYFRNLWD